MSDFPIFVALDDSLAATPAGAAVSRRIPLPRDLPLDLLDVQIVAKATVTQHATNYATVNVKNSAGDTLATRNTKTGEGGTLTAGEVESMTLSGDVHEIAGGFLDVELVKASSGVACNLGVMLTTKRGRSV